MIRTQNLTKIFKKRTGFSESFGGRLKDCFARSYETVVAVDHVTLTLNKGEIFGLIGPNGAGKTTFVKLLSTLVRPDGGSAAVEGCDLVARDAEVRKRIGAITGEYAGSLYWRLTGRQNLRFFGDLYGLEDRARVDQLIDLMGLQNWQDEPVMKYSSGMKHKLALARALLNDPPVLLLDEPTTGIDPKSNCEIKAFIRSLRDKTILWTSHNLYEVDEICDRIAVIDKGRIVFEGKPQELKKRFSRFEKIVFTFTVPRAGIMTELANSRIVDDFTVEIMSDNIDRTLGDVARLMGRCAGMGLRSVNTCCPSLEDAFISLLSSPEASGRTPEA